MSEQGLAQKILDFMTKMEEEAEKETCETFSAHWYFSGWEGIKDICESFQKGEAPGEGQEKEWIKKWI